MNVENTNKLINLLEGLEDGRFIMRAFVGQATGDSACRLSERVSYQLNREDTKALNHCGTAACIAGWAAFLANPEGTNVTDIMQIAQDWLGIGEGRGVRLFYGNLSSLDDPERKGNLEVLTRREAIAELRELVAQETPVRGQEGFRE